MDCIDVVASQKLQHLSSRVAWGIVVAEKPSFLPELEPLSVHSVSKICSNLHVRYRVDGLPMGSYMAVNDSLAIKKEHRHNLPCAFRHTGLDRGRIAGPFPSRGLLFQLWVIEMDPDFVPSNDALEICLPLVKLCLKFLGIWQRGLPSSEVSEGEAPIARKPGTFEAGRARCCGHCQFRLPTPLLSFVPSVLGSLVAWLPQRRHFRG